MNVDRRSLLGLCGAAAGLTLVSSRAHGLVKLFATPALAPTGAARTLILLQLSGGNDGLDTIVPFGDDLYRRARPSLGLAKKDTLPLDDYRGFHASLKSVRQHFDAGRLALIEGAGYPQPVRSHFKSLDIWHTADARGRDAGDGWIGRLCQQVFASETNPNLVVHVGANVPYALHSSSHPPVSFVNPQAYRWAGGENEVEAYGKVGEMGERESKPKKRAGESSLDFVRRVLSDGQTSSEQVRRAVALYSTGVTYPRNDALALALQDVAALVNGDTGTRVLSVELGGFDTHTDQRNRHDQLMRQLDGALGALLDDLGRSEAGRAAIVVVFSEFGRRVAENGARGTDHGVAGPMLVLGHQIKGGLFGKHPALDKLDEGDLVHTVDFRSVYAAVIERAFGVKHEKVLGARYPVVAVV
jgi:uncharacterized protein (DUF1501 family)